MPKSWIEQECERNWRLRWMLRWDRYVKRHIEDAWNWITDAEVWHFPEWPEQPYLITRRTRRKVEHDATREDDLR